MITRGWLIALGATMARVQEENSRTLLPSELLSGRRDIRGRHRYFAQMCGPVPGLVEHRRMPGSVANEAVGDGELWVALT